MINKENIESWLKDEIKKIDLQIKEIRKTIDIIPKNNILSANQINEYNGRINELRAIQGELYTVINKVNNMQENEK